VEQWPKRSLAEIRALHRQIKSDLARGIDPVEARRNSKLRAQLEQAQTIEHTKREIARLAAEAAAHRTFADAITQWHKLELSRRKNGGQETMRAISKDVMPVLGEVPLTGINRVMVVDILDNIVARGARVMANLLFADLRQFFNYALAREWIETHPLAGLRKEHIGGRQAERSRYLSEAEILDLAKRIPNARLSKPTELAIWIMLSTCCRVGELTQARWEQIDLERGEWLIPAGNSKNAKSHTVYLSGFAKTHFGGLKAITDGSELCFPSRDAQTAISAKSITKQIQDRVREAALAKRTKAAGTLLLSGGEWTPHDLRRTGATMMGELGISGEVIDRCLNHVEPNRLKRTYQLQELKSEQRDAWRRLGDRITVLLASEESKNVVIGKFQRSI